MSTSSDVGTACRVLAIGPRVRAVHRVLLPFLFLSFSRARLPQQTESSETAAPPGDIGCLDMFRTPESSFDVRPGTRAGNLTVLRVLARELAGQRFALWEWFTAVYDSVLPFSGLLTVTGVSSRSTWTSPRRRRRRRRRRDSSPAGVQRSCSARSRVSRGGGGGSTSGGAIREGFLEAARHACARGSKCETYGVYVYSNRTQIIDMADRRY
ncbi:hypothetical protein OH77DRAFT_631530 [Trametes cingulata]|nr:hypothetical protein OH77DRAFT_631530 [Trametes cingulata]